MICTIALFLKFNFNTKTKKQTTQRLFLSLNVYFLAHIERVEYEHVMVVLGQCDYIAFASDFQSTASRNLREQKKNFIL